MYAESRPSGEEDLPLVINWHSVKNRFLMRGKNASGWLCWRLFLPVAWRDMMTFGYALLRDQRMLSALAYPWRVRESIRRKRAIIQSRRRLLTRICYGGFAIPRRRCGKAQ